MRAVSGAGELSVERLDEGDTATLRFAGDLTIGDAAALWRRAASLLAPPAPRYRFDLGGVAEADGSAVALLMRLEAGLRARGSHAEITGAAPEIQALIRIHGGPEVATLKAPPGRLGIVEQVGERTLGFLGGQKDFLAYVGDLVVSALAALRRPATVNWGDLGQLVERTGADAFAINVTIAFLVGFIIAYVAAAILAMYGANVYVADLVGISMTRELGPLMTAIVVAGRSGAAFSAEIGTMKVSEEIDALRTLGFDPYRYLVFPRALALCLTFPILTLLADIFGIAGGLFVAISRLGLTTDSFLLETQKAVIPDDIVFGVIKSVAFALAVALIACQKGLATRGGAEGVGRQTTSAVVTTLFTLIVIDALFTVVFETLGIGRYA
jgi:phospholipid/cholesterol/gamma-HCH transport system permease protein